MSGAGRSRSLPGRARRTPRGTGAPATPRPGALLPVLVLAVQEEALVEARPPRRAPSGAGAGRHRRGSSCSDRRRRRAEARRLRPTPPPGCARASGPGWDGPSPGRAGPAPRRRGLGRASSSSCRRGTASGSMRASGLSSNTSRPESARCAERQVHGGGEPEVGAGVDVAGPGPLHHGRRGSARTSCRRRATGYRPASAARAWARRVRGSVGDDDDVEPAPPPVTGRAAPRRRPPAQDHARAPWPAAPPTTTAPATTSPALKAVGQ